jgi:hypothetical protein
LFTRLDSAHMCNASAGAGRSGPDSSFAGKPGFDAPTIARLLGAFFWHHQLPNMRHKTIPYFCSIFLISGQILCKEFFLL